jgi:hypothetical protein
MVISWFSSDAYPKLGVFQIVANQSNRTFCPHCHNTVDQNGDAASGEVLCHACGSGFRLERDATTDGAFRTKEGDILGHPSLSGATRTKADSGAS